MDVSVPPMAQDEPYSDLGVTRTKPSGRSTSEVLLALRRLLRMLDILARIGSMCRSIVPPLILCGLAIARLFNPPCVEKFGNAASAIDSSSELESRRAGIVPDRKVLLKLPVRWACAKSRREVGGFIGLPRSSASTACRTMYIRSAGW